MKTEELRELGKGDLLQHLKNFKKELFKLYSEKARGSLTDFSRIQKLKKDIARIYTLLREGEESEK
ncbi:50S ribosomal protein L29 [Candidatus Aerophobetes bacterium]|nr:50S ribosomal protein L29 [Candidatus Aerophobetes bacterium]